MGIEDACRHRACKCGPWYGATCLRGKCAERRYAYAFQCLADLKNEVSPLPNTGAHQSPELVVCGAPGVPRLRRLVEHKDAHWPRRRGRRLGLALGVRRRRRRLSGRRQRLLQLRCHHQWHVAGLTQHHLQGGRRTSVFGWGQSEGMHVRRGQALHQALAPGTWRSGAEHEAEPQIKVEPGIATGCALAWGMEHGWMRCAQE